LNPNITIYANDIYNYHFFPESFSASSDGGCLIGEVLWNPTIPNLPRNLLMRFDSNLISAPNLIRGAAYIDPNLNCEKDTLEQKIGNRFLKIVHQQDTFFQVVNRLSGYVIPSDTGNYEITIHNNLPYWEICEPTKNVNVFGFNETFKTDFNLQPLVECAQLEVSVVVPILRRCFNNSVIVNYCNNGTINAQNAQVKLILSPNLDFVSSTKPISNQNGDTLIFVVGEVMLEDCDQFVVICNVNCDSTTLGQTLCIEAFITPDTLCAGAPAWSGGQVHTQATCAADSVELTIQNIGTAPTGTLDYVIIEDIVIWREATFNLDAGEILKIKVPANGSTWRIEAMQPAGFPQSNLSIAFVEGCGWSGTMPFPGGFITQFPDEDGIPTQNTACRVVTGSYDPNDKQGFPEGVGTAHNILPNTPIEYLIRFQNTGTDTAFKVVVRDVLPKQLDLLSVQLGASSHPCRMEWLDNEELVFTFDHINLPHKVVNEPASNGFVQFTVRPKADLPLGTSIENEALIYFDFNQPIHTNFTLHTVNIDFLDRIDGTNEPEKSNNSNDLLSPNPVKSGAICKIENFDFSVNSLSLMDVNGKLLHTLSVRNGAFRVPNDLVSGVYFWSIDHKKRGKLVVF
jgi:uncharacterized repeat protein (TIGR01451 family)